MRVRRRAQALVIAMALGLTPLLSASPASAGEVWNYPEFPYQPTTYTEAYRGQFHFSSQQGWMNDPNGLVYANGEYHFFYQHNPHGLAWDTMHWGHATSKDLVHWTQKPIALEPDVHPGTLFSGGGVVDKDNTSGLKTGADDPIVVFANTDGVSVYYSNDNGKTFQAYDKGRKRITIPVQSRDPKVAWDAAHKQWVMVVWSENDADNHGNGVEIYTSPNLLDWTHSSRYSAEWLFECPDLFQVPVDGDPNRKKWVLTTASGKYVVGDFDGTGFHADNPTPQPMDFGTAYAGGTFYAAETFQNAPDGRVVQMAWQGGNVGTTWTGNATFPAQLGLISTPEGLRITRTPVDELSSLASGGKTWKKQNVKEGGANPFKGVRADTYELSATVDVSKSTARKIAFGLHVRSDNSADRTVVYDKAAGTLDGHPVGLENGKLKLRLLVDRGQLEVFADGGTYSLSDNVNFDSGADSQGIRLYAEGGTAKLDSAVFRRLDSSWGTGQSTLDTDLGDRWNAVSGNWTDVSGGKQGRGSGNGFYLSTRTAADGVYQGDVSLGTAQAAGLTFRANDKGEGYTANIDKEGKVKLWRPGRDIATYNTPVTADSTHHLKVTTEGSRIRVFLDNGTDPVIDATDDAYTGGRYGANVFNGTATLQNLNTGGAGLDAFPTTKWATTGGNWTTAADGLHGSSSGDGFYLSERTGEDFTYEGDLSVTNGAATGLTFRANDKGEGYTATLDTKGQVKLWRPGKDLATHDTAITEGRTYHVKVRAEGDRIRVWLGDGATPVIDTTDATYGNGRFGVNAYNGNVIAQHLRIS
ncbi:MULTISPECIES: glycoside hydrolase family 32 protein [unclassified Streptomyces]|uniref:glycoside hydrolase family 32 protein n=1 Tax=unclassified Streptomyces TaxID=2593676 RepID=UPI00036C32DB|nr:MULTISPECIES: glycoside hydrolase family 32 protein [unclassified Streptomyces]MYQ75791.1 glycoside hydrolase family 32 protein [Streptomyces sp. SID4923]